MNKIIFFFCLLIALSYQSIRTSRTIPGSQQPSVVQHFGYITANSNQIIHFLFFIILTIQIETYGVE